MIEYSTTALLCRGILKLIEICTKNLKTSLKFYEDWGPKLSRQVMAAVHVQLCMHWSVL